MQAVRSALRRHVHQLVGFEDGAVALDRPAGDPGLFGPASAAWKVHADFTAMMAGGIAALLTQMLHPGALSGVWDHSGFRADPAGRLRRTAQFVAGTTYGATAEAERLIVRVRAIHDRVRGTMPDGTTYSASDPALLTWVHTAEATCFLAAHLRYRDPAFAPAMQDRYFAETAEVAARLGATDIPRNRREAAAYLAAVRPQLRADARTREIAAAILAPRASEGAAAGAAQLLQDAAIDLLPGWAARLHGLHLDPWRRSRARLGMRGLGTVLRWALTEGSAARAAERVAPTA